MKVLRDMASMRQWSLAQKVIGNRVGFVPTMGSLHDGHLALVDIAKAASDVVVVSIFVNPTQFGPNEDFESYPRNEKLDLDLCEARGVDAVYIPQVDEVYPDDYFTYVAVNTLGDHLCGASRPDHFQGVTTIVSKLFNVVSPDIAVFGQKDAQQARILEKMSRDLQNGVQIVIAPIIRENDGLAMSSRNVRLKEEHRRQASTIFRALSNAKAANDLGQIDSTVLIDLIKDQIEREAVDATVDYIEIVDWVRLSPIELIDRKALIGVALFFGDVRLIDNVILEKKN